MQWKQIHFSHEFQMWHSMCHNNALWKCACSISKIQKTRRQSTDCKAARHYRCIWLSCVDCWFCVYIHFKIQSNYWMQKILIAAFNLRSGTFLIWMVRCSEHRQTKLCTKEILHWQPDVDIGSFTYQFLWLVVWKNWNPYWASLKCLLIHICSLFILYTCAVCVSHWVFTLYSSFWAHQYSCDQMCSIMRTQMQVKAELMLVM